MGVAVEPFRFADGDPVHNLTDAVPASSLTSWIAAGSVLGLNSSSTSHQLVASRPQDAGGLDGGPGTPSPVHLDALPRTPHTSQRC